MLARKCDHNSERMHNIELRLCHHRGEHVFVLSHRRGQVRAALGHFYLKSAMQRLIKVIERFLTHRRLGQAFRDKVRNLVNTNKTDWDYRAEKCGKSILAAVCFRETALAGNRRKDSKIYQPIGFYYAMFHMSLAMLWINPRVKASDLKKIHHRKLFSLVDSQLVRHKYVSEDYYASLCWLKELRESCNYSFGYRDSLDADLSKAAKKTYESFDDALIFIHEVLAASNSLFRVQVGIADGFGDDTLETYLTDRHKEKVSKYLVDHGLSA